MFHMTRAIELKINTKNIYYMRWIFQNVMNQHNIVVMCDMCAMSWLAARPSSVSLPHNSLDMHH